MKKVVFLSVILFNFIGFSQEIGSAGRLLQNENRRNVAIDKKRINFDYRWECTYDEGYSEVFIRIPERGRFTIALGEQEITNSNGIFRFFDVSSRPQPLNIWEGRRLLYSVTIHPRNNIRMVLDFFTQRGLFLLEELIINNIREVNYGRNWNDVWNRSYRRGNTMQGNDFEIFYQMFKRQTFDNEKLSFFRMQKNSTAFTSAQVALLLKEFSFDDNRLQLAKEAYENVLDPENYYRLFDSFSFKSYSEKFSDFLINKRR